MHCTFLGKYFFWGENPLFPSENLEEHYFYFNEEHPGTTGLRNTWKQQEELVAKSLIKPKKRKPTKPSKAAKERRLENKKKD